MKKTFHLLFFLPLMIAAGPLCQAQPSAAQFKTLDSALTKLYERGMFNGVVLVGDHGKAVYSKAFGIADISTNKPLTTRSAFNLASVSKQFFCMMAMILQEQGKLKYDEKVQTYLPDFPYDNITVRHLMTHTCGMADYFDLWLSQLNTLDTLTNPELIGLLKIHRPALMFEPGSRWEYSNTGYVVLASVIEQVAGMPVEDYFQQTIAVPLGLKNTYIYKFTMKQSPESRVMGFDRVNGQHIPNDIYRIDGVVGDGNIYSSAEDLLKWEQSLYTTRLVSAKTMQEAFTPVRLNDGTTYNYGFGWGIKTGGKVFSHTGSWVGFLNVISRDTERQSTFIVLSSSSDPTALKVVDEILAGKQPELPVTELIYNVQLIDGTGLPAKKTSVRIKDKRIWETGDLKPFPGEKTTDGKGLTLAPGFIDSHSHHFGGLKRNPEGLAPVNQGITTIVIGQDGSSYAIDSIRSFFTQHTVAINVATYTGQSTLREEILGEDDLYRTATPEELAKMKAILKKEMASGSLGLSTGLEYEAAFYSNRDEVVALAKVAAEAGGRYISHIRSEDINLDEAIDETIEIGRATGMPVQISHIKIAKMDRWGHAPLILAALQQARADGIDITADCYPYDFWNSTLRVLFPNRDYTNPASAEFAVNQLFDPEKSILVNYAPQPAYARKTVGEIARIRQETPAKTLMFLIAEAEAFEKKYPDYDGDIETIMGKSMDDADVISFLTWPHTNICSDGGWSGHPRGHGAFTRVLGRYVREKKIMPLETAIYKMTGLAAEHLGITDRGLVKADYYADLVLFDPAKVIDNADIQDSKALSTGIEKVWVNGQLIYEGQKATGRYPGMFVGRE